MELNPMTPPNEDQQTPATPADAGSRPWEKFKDSEVSEGPSGGDKPWQKYGNAEFVTLEDKQAADSADAYAEAAERVAEEMTTGEKVLDWIGDAGRATFFGPIADPIAAQIISWQQGDDVTYAQAYEAIQANNKATKNTSANIVGAIVGGGILAKGGMKVAAAAAKRGYCQGAMKYLGRDKRWNRFLGNTVTGAGAGMLEEGIRVGLEETFDKTAGLGFDGERWGESVVMGALIGGAAGNAMALISGAAKTPLDFLKRTLGNDNANWQKASHQLLKEFRTSNETVEEAGVRFQQEVVAFQQANGRLPAAAEILKPEQVRNMAEVIRMHNGLDIRARELGEAGVERALKEYDAVVTNGRGQVPSPEVVLEGVENLFTDTMTRHGKKMVPVSNDVAQQLIGNRRMIAALQTSPNKGAAKLGQILDHKAAIGGVRKKVSAILNKSDAANRKAALTEVQRELAEELDTLFNEAGAESSRVAELRNIIQLQKAIDAQIGASNSADFIGRELDELRPKLMRMDAELKNFEENGLLISLSDANDLRRMASEAFRMSARGDDAFAMNTARQVRDSVASIGSEVPEYAQVIKTFNLENLRAESMSMGRKGARGEMILEDLQSRMRTGRPDARGMRQTSPDQLAAVRRGTGEGARLELSQAVRKGGVQGVKSAVRLANSPQAQDSLAAALGDMPAKEITRQAAKVAKTYEGMGMMTGARSASELAQELEQASEIATGALFGNIGGAARVGLFKKVLRDLKMPRGTAERVVEMLGNPNEMEKGMRFMQSKGIRIAPLYAAIAAHLSEPVPNE